MSAYILPNSILLLAIVAVISLVAWHLPEASRQLEDAGIAHAESAQDVVKRWLHRARGGLRSFWRFVLEAKGLRDPKGSKFRMRQLLEQNRLPRQRGAVKARISSRHSVQLQVTQTSDTQVLSEVASVQVATPETTIVAPTVELPAVETSAAQAENSTIEVVVPKPPKASSWRKAAVKAVDPAEAMQRAKTFIDEKEFLRARHELEPVADSFQESPVFWARLGYVQYHLGAYAEAVRCYQKSLALDSNQANRYYNLALAHEAAQEHAESLAALDQALALDPGNVKYKQTRDALKTM